MADEISMSAMLKLVLGDKSQEWSLGTLQDDITGSDYTWNTHVLAITVDEPVILPDVTGAPGWILIRNNSTTAAEIVAIRQADEAANMLEKVLGERATVKASAAHGLQLISPI